MKPLIIINFKTYVTGEKALKLATICDRLAKRYKQRIIVAVQHADIYRIASIVKIPVYAQHIDAAEPGKNTGLALAEAAKAAGAKGTLISHSEHRLRVDEIEAAIAKCRKLHLKSLVCANDSRVGKALSDLNPDYVAVEPPELIGGTLSVSSARPKLIAESVHGICGRNHCHKVIVGAGVHTREDILKAVDLGAEGVLIASGVAKASNPEKALLSLIGR